MQFELGENRVQPNLHWKIILHFFSDKNAELLKSTFTITVTTFMHADTVFAFRKHWKVILFHRCFVFSLGQAQLSAV